MASTESVEMPDLNQSRIDTLPAFLTAMIELIKLTEASSSILFRSGFRENYRQAYREVVDALSGLRERSQISNPGEHRRMQLAGLSGAQLALKLESFERSYMTLKREGGIDNLEDVLEKGSTLLGSIAGAIPYVGSLAQELVDFILKELRRRLKFWRGR